jgi:hypothetical protein
VGKSGRGFRAVFDKGLKGHGSFFELAPTAALSIHILHRAGASAFRYGFPTRSARSSLTRSGMTNPSCFRQAVEAARGLLPARTGPQSAIHIALQASRRPVELHVQRSADSGKFDKSREREKR